MPKATLEFNLPEDNEPFIQATHALDWALVCWDVEQALRLYCKHGHKFKTADEAIGAIRDYLSAIMEDRNVNFDMIS